jgi:uncharacterized protein YkwD
MRRFIAVSFFAWLIWSGFVLRSAYYSQPATALQSEFPLGSPSFEERVLELVNEERWNNGQLPPLKGSAPLHNAADGHSINMATRDFFDHCDLDTKTSPWDRMEAAGYTGWSSAAENIAAGYSTPEDVINGWMNSAGHRDSILSTGFREIGIGYAFQGNDQGNVRFDTNGDCTADSADGGPYGHYWTQNFGRIESVMPVVIEREVYETTSREVNLYVYGASWAVEMRFRNEAGPWSAWQSYAADVAWTLSSGNGVKSVSAEIRDSNGETRSASDTIVLNEEITGPVLLVEPNALNFIINSSSPISQAQTLAVSNAGQGSMGWTISQEPPVAWLTSDPAAGSIGEGMATDVEVTASSSGLSFGVYTTTLRVDAGTAVNSPQFISVTFLYTDQLSIYLPGIFKP